MVTNVVIPVPGTHVNLSPVGFHLWAKQFLACRRALVEPTDSFSPVPYFLNCRAIELELKARHLEAVNQKAVKDKYGHNLERSYQSLPLQQQVLSPGELKTLQAANNIYKDKGFEYFSVSHAVTAFKKFPNLAELDAVTNKLVQS
ncbi:MAG TPA: hypothetical protein VE029_01415 [Rhizobacter sp.]|nr:hypothetical protein [Rhizobacter sp.]